VFLSCTFVFLLAAHVDVVAGASLRALAAPPAGGAGAAVADADADAAVAGAGAAAAGARALSEKGDVLVADDVDRAAHEKLDSFIDGANAHLAASLCSVGAIVISVHLMYKHLQHYSRPLLQRQIIRIVMIVPVYAFCSALSLAFDHYAPYINALRDIYEALCIHCFLSLMLDFPGGEDAVVQGIKDKPLMAHPVPCCCWPKMRLGIDFIVYMKRTTLQFVFLKPMMTVLSIICMMADVYDTPALQTFLLVVYNLSYTTALYGLLLYYYATKHLMKGFRPVSKFAAVKIIVFATYYQSLAVVAIPGMDALGSSEKWNGESTVPRARACTRACARSPAFAFSTPRPLPPACRAAPPPPSFRLHHLHRDASLQRDARVLLLVQGVHAGRRRHQGPQGHGLRGGRARQHPQRHELALGAQPHPGRVRPQRRLVRHEAAVLLLGGPAHHAGHRGRHHQRGRRERRAGARGGQHQG
jgi:hypothetical protein